MPGQSSFLALRIGHSPTRQASLTDGFVMPVEHSFVWLITPFCAEIKRQWTTYAQEETATASAEVCCWPF